MTVLPMPSAHLHPLQAQMDQLGVAAKDAYRVLASAPTVKKNAALLAAATALRTDARVILLANAKDMEAGEQKGLTKAQLDRLMLDEARIEAMAKGLEAIVALEDPVGVILKDIARPNGLNISRVAVPLGVVGVIYEARPNVTVDAGALCLKSGNAVILRGGSESIHSSRALVDCMQRGLREAGLPEAAIQMVPTPDREAVGILLRMNEYVDVIVPRGGKSLTARVQNESRIPTFLHLDGNCHSYVHASAKPDLVCEVIVNAKMRRTGICGATESILVDASAAMTLLPPLLEALLKKGCEIRGDVATQSLNAAVKPATDEDWGTEYLDSIVSVKTVGGVEEAIAHINQYGSHHTDAILAEDAKAVDKFLREVDSAIVMHNTSTQFADGGEFGMGAEIGIATGRLHARGPVGLEQLVTYKYKVYGDGQVRP